MKINVEELLDELGILNIRTSGNEVNFSCPFPEHVNGDASPSARMNAESAVWICHGCKRQGTAVTFLSDLTGVSPIEALRQLRAQERVRPAPPADELLGRLRDLLARDDEDHPPVPDDGFEPDPAWVAIDWTLAQESSSPAYLLKRGFTGKTLNRIGVMWDPVRQRVVLPVMQDGKLVGAKGRTIHETIEPKYFIYPPEYRASRTVFLLDEAYRLRGRLGPLVICEGELDALKLQQESWAAVALGGSRLSEYQAKLLLSHNWSRFVFFFDWDDAGMFGALEGAALLGKWASDVRIVAPHAKDPCSLDQLENCILIDNSHTPNSFRSMCPHGKRI